MDTLKIFLRDIERTPILDRDAQRALVARAQAGDIEARNQLVATNLPYCVRLAHQIPRCGVEVEDLIQVGALGLMHAVEKFDLARPVAFLSYAGYWAWQMMTRYIDDARFTIRVPNWLLHGNRPRRRDPDCLALVHAVSNMQSLDAPRSPEEERGLSEMLAATDFDLVEQRDAIEFMGIKLATLPPHERDILLRRAQGEKLRSIADSYHFSRDRIRQLEAAALRKLAEHFGE